MASPQLENGYTSIANEIMEALAMIRIPGEARQILDVIFRKTYGFHKQSDFISLSQFHLLTKLDTKSVCRGLKKLIGMGIITVIGSRTGNVYKFQKDHEKWVGSGKSATGNLATGISANQPVAKVPHTKDIYTKDNKHISPTMKIEEYRKLGEQSSDGVNAVIGAFAKVDHGRFMSWYKIKAQRSACERMISEYRLDRVLWLVRQLPRINQMAYMPTAHSPLELEKKFRKIIDAMKAKNDKIRESKIIKSKARKVV